MLMLHFINNKRMMVINRVHNCIIIVVAPHCDHWRVVNTIYSQHKHHRAVSVPHTSAYHMTSYILHNSVFIMVEDTAW